MVVEMNLLFSHLLLSSALQACGDPKAKPSYLVDKNLESAVKFIVRKFPAVETRNNNVSVLQWLLGVQAFIQFSSLILRYVFTVHSLIRPLTLFRCSMMCLAIFFIVKLRF